MASQTLTVSMALSMLDIPFPEDEDMSDDEFDGYIDPNEISAEGSDGNGEDSEPSDDVPPIPDFQQPTGPSVDMTDKSLLDFFKLLVNDAKLDHIVEQTNIYAQQYINATTLPSHSRIHGWNKEVHDRDELKKFLAMIITMGLVNYPHVEDYWATYWPYAMPTFSKVNRCYTMHVCMCTCSCTCMYIYMQQNLIMIFRNSYIIISQNIYTCNAHIHTSYYLDYKGIIRGSVSMHTYMKIFKITPKS